MTNNNLELKRLQSELKKYLLESNYLKVKEILKEQYVVLKNDEKFIEQIFTWVVKKGIPDILDVIIDTYKSLNLNIIEKGLFWLTFSKKNNLNKQVTYKIIKILLSKYPKVLDVNINKILLKLIEEKNEESRQIIKNFFKKGDEREHYPSSLIAGLLKMSSKINDEDLSTFFINYLTQDKSYDLTYLIKEIIEQGNLYVFKKILQLLKNNISNEAININLLTICEKQNIEMLKAFFENIEVKIDNEVLGRALYKVVEKNNRKLSEYLLNKIDFTTKDDIELFKSLFSSAALNEHYELVNLLLKYNAKKNVISKNEIKKIIVLYNLNIEYINFEY